MRIVLWFVDVFLRISRWRRKEGTFVMTKKSYFFHKRPLDVISEAFYRVVMNLRVFFRLVF